MSRVTRHASCLLLVALALAFRLPGLNDRPMHLDEAVQAVKAGILMEKGEYHYDPFECHGPTLYYFTLPFAWIQAGGEFARTVESTYRIVDVAFNVGLILLIFWLRDGLGKGAVLWAGLLTAVSPAFVYYGRFYQQESILVFFSAGAIVAGWRYTRTRAWGWVVAVGACLGLMHATKETCVLAYDAMVVAVVLVALWGRSAKGTAPRIRQLLSAKVIAGVFVAAVVVSVVFFSSFFTHFAGVPDSIKTYTHYLGRAAGDTPHVHAWDYYLEMLTWWRYGNGPAWSEGFIVALAVLGLIIACVPKLVPPGNVHLLRFLGLYTVVLTATYSAIPYKTPWCFLGFLHGMILLAGVGAAALVRWMPCRISKAAACIALLAGAAHLGWQAHRASFPFCADPRNPYVYAQTSSDSLRLVERVNALAEVHEDGRALLIKIITDPQDYWPLPWYLRKFPAKGFWQEPPADVNAPVVITSTKLQPEIEKKLLGDYQVEYYGLRPDVLLAAYIRRDLWDAFMADRR